MKKATLANRQLAFPVFEKRMTGIKYLVWATIFTVSIFNSSCKKSIDDPGAGTGEVQGISSLRATEGGKIGVNVLLNTSVTNAILGELERFGNVVKTFPEINALAMVTTTAKLAQIKGLQYVTTASPDAERSGSPVDNLLSDNFTSGRNSWDLDAINVTDYGVGRVVSQAGKIDAFKTDRVAHQSHNRL